MIDLVGQQLGNYRLLRALGQGAFATVYLGEHQYLERLDAIKVLHVQIEPTKQKSFLGEARTIAQLVHPHIIPVYDFGFEDQTPYLAMGYMKGGTLRSRHLRGSQLSLEEVMGYVKQIAEGLQHAHNHHIIHCDIKPENILLDADNCLLLSDFGISVLTSSSKQLSTQDQAGTPCYMAPEQWSGKPRFASDQYALAIMVYEWLCGEPPFSGNALEIWRQHMYTDLPPLRTMRPDLPPKLEQVVRRALAKEHRDRFVSVQAFAQALIRAGQTVPQVEKNDSQMTILWKPLLSSQTHTFSRRSLPARIIGSTAVAVLGVSGLVFFLNRGANGNLSQPKSTSVSTPNLTSLSQGTTLAIYSGHSGDIQGLAWSPDSTLIASCGQDRTVQVWHAVTGILSWSDSRINALYTVAWSHNGERIASAGIQGLVTIQDSISGHTPKEYPQPNRVSSVAWSPDDQYIASGSWDGTMRIRDTNDGAVLYVGQYPATVLTVAWSPSGKFIAAAGNDTTIRVWDAIANPVPDPHIIHTKHSGSIYTIAWSRDDKYIASAGVDSIVRVCNVTSGDEVYQYHGHLGTIRSIAWSPDSKYIASASVDRTVKIWKAFSGASPFTYSEHHLGVDAVAWSLDGTLIASGGVDTNVRVWKAL